MLEHWKAIPGYEGFYEVSDLGRIRSIDRFIYNRWSGKNDRSVKGKIRKTEEAHDGYRRVRLLRNGKTKKYFVHRLVMHLSQIRILKNTLKLITKMKLPMIIA